jgi:hypothetical protein
MENYGKHTLLVGLALGCVFGSAQLFGGGFRPLMCGKDVINSHEQVGAQLNDLIPPGSQLFWAVKSDMLLLYLPGVEVYTPQLDVLFTYLGDEEGNTEQMLRFGWWNEELREFWIGEADYVLIEARFFDYTWMERMARGEFGAFYVTDSAESCRMDGARVFVLEKSP